MVAVAIGVGVGTLGAGIAGSSIASKGAQTAAQTEANAQTNATNVQNQEFNTAQSTETQDLAQAQAFDQQYYQQAQGIEQPFITAGTGATSELTGEISGANAVPGQAGPLGAEPSLTDMSQLPGYNFTLQQGMLATQNAAAAQGLGVSGVALKGASSYAENLANTYYNNYLSNYWANQNNRYNMLAGVMNTGAGAANTLSNAAVQTGANLGQQTTTTGANIGQQAVTTGANIANTITSTAAQQAAYQQSGANLLAAGVTGGTSSGISNALLANALIGSGNPSTITPPGPGPGTGGLY